MNLRLLGLLAVAGFAVVSLLGSAQSLAQNAYITNQGDNTVSVIATATNTVTTTITDPRLNTPVGVAVTPDGSRVYVANNVSSTVSAISTANNQVMATIPVGNGTGGPVGLAVAPNGSTVYVANAGSSSVSVISTANNKVTATISVGSSPFGVAVSPDASTVYVVNEGSNTVSVISAASNAVTATIPVGNDPRGVAVTPDGSKVYVTKFGSNGVSVIDTTNDMVTMIADPSSSFNAPLGVAVTPDGSKVYVTNFFGNTVSVIDTTNDTVTAVVSGSTCAAAIAVGSFPFGVAVSPDGSTVYVANEGNGIAPGTVSVIATTSNAVTAQITVGLQAVAFGIFITPEVQSVPASGTSCNGVYNGTFMGDITVSAGQDCTFIDGGQVTGNVNVQSGGHFSSTGTKITKNVTISGSNATWSMVRNQVDGNVQAQDIPDPPTSPTNFMCGTTVNGDLQFQNNGTAVQIGSADPLICAGNTIGGNLQVNNNTSTVLIFDNVVGNDLQVGNNTGPLDVVGNNVGGSLQCQGNSMLIMGGMNTAKQTQGQCN